MSQSKTFIADNLLPKISANLKSKETQKDLKDLIDKFLATKIKEYFGLGPSTRPIFPYSSVDEYYKLLGVTADEVQSILDQSKNIKSSWFTMKPYNVSDTLMTIYFLQSKNEEFEKIAIWYLIIEIYPPLHFRYFKFNVNEACMAYTINNLSAKFNIKKSNSLWDMLTQTCYTAMNIHRNRLLSLDDICIAKYLNDIQSRINSLMKNIMNVYYDNYYSGKFLKEEHESFDQDNYYEADSNSYAIERITNKVTTHLVINGPDMKIVQLAAKTNQVSVNEMRNYTNQMISDKHEEEIRQIVNSILFLYLFNDDGDAHGSDTIGTNEFMLYCLTIYKKSNTSNKNINLIKGILDKWLDTLGLTSKVSRTATIVNFRKALYTFFVMEIQKIA